MSQLSQVNWVDWMERWDRQQAGYLPRRDQQIDLMLEIVERIVGQPTSLLDLASGPGSIASQSAGRFPGTPVFAVDVDPFLLELGRRTRGVATIEFLDADLRQAGWDEVLPAALGWRQA